MTDILSMPTTPRPRASRFVLHGNTRQFVSPLTGATQTLELVGSRWMATYELPVMKRPEAEAWAAFLSRCNGLAGRFYAGDPAALTARGPATGAPVVAGASQTGTALLTDGWTDAVTGILLVGDYIAWETPSGWRELHKMVESANSDGAGLATLQITPPIRESPADNAPLIVVSPTCVMRLATADEAAWTMDRGSAYGIAFNAEEAFAGSA